MEWNHDDDSTVDMIPEIEVLAMEFVTKIDLWQHFGNELAMENIYPLLKHIIAIDFDF